MWKRVEPSDIRTIQESMCLLHTFTVVMPQPARRPQSLDEIQARLDEAKQAAEEGESEKGG